MVDEGVGPVTGYWFTSVCVNVNKPASCLIVSLQRGRLGLKKTKPNPRNGSRKEMLGGKKKKRKC